ncbi:MAG: LysR family transcriptional regulator [Brachymonas sp.]
MAKPSETQFAEPASSLIELRLWQQFVAVAEHLHFGRAAAQLHMTQPPLTQAIAGMEARIGVQLFERSKRSVSLTAAGAALLPSARELLGQARQMSQQAQAAASGEVGRLRIGFVSPLGLGPLPGWVRAFRQRQPRIDLELVEATGDVQLQMFEQRQLDAGFILHAEGSVGNLDSIGLAHLSLEAEPMIVAMPEQHALAAAKFDLKRLLREPLVLFPERILPSIHQALAQLYATHGERMLVVQEAIQMQTIVNLVSAGLGIAWVPQTVSLFQRKGVVYREIPARSKAQVWCHSSLVWREAGRDPVLARFVELVRRQSL